MQYHLPEHKYAKENTFSRLKYAALSTYDFLLTTIC